MKIKTDLRQIIYVLALMLVAFIVQADAPSVSVEKTKICFQCNGAGKSKCSNCKNGEADCPGDCLKLSKGSWIHMTVAGHPPTDVWQKFTADDGRWQAYNQNHVGHVLQTIDGLPKDVGPCPICHGKTKVKCPVCKGTGEMVCSLCAGKKVVPESWTAFDNPKMKNRPSRFKMKDGTTIIGRRTILMGDHATVRTEKGDVEIKTTDIIAEEKPTAK
jgi:hypothetical protein